MRKIFKYQIPHGIKRIPYISEIKLPVESKLVHVGLDPENEVCAWFEHEEKYIDQTRRQVFELMIVGTGQTVSNGFFNHYKSFVQHGLVFHIYIRKGNENNQ